MQSRDRNPARIAILFPGQGGQHPRMGAGLYGRDPDFTLAMDAFFGAPGHDGDRLRDSWLSREPSPAFDDASCAQPLLFAVGFALARTLRARGVAAEALLGHSVGELAAAAEAGVFHIRDSGRLMQVRGEAMSRTVRGGMLVVAASADELTPYLTATVVAAAINTPRQTVLSGPSDDLATTARALAAAGYACQPARALQAFHAPACEEAARHFAVGLSDVRLSAPSILVQSTRTGCPVTPKQATDPYFWAAQLALPVLFWNAFDALLGTGDFTFFEAGPAGSCSAMARRHPALRTRSSVLLPLLPGSGSDPDESRRVLDAATAAVVPGR